MSDGGSDGGGDGGTVGVLGGQVVLVTGGGSGLGAAMARRLAADGARVVVNDINGPAAEAVAAEVGGEASVFDVTDAGAFDGAVDAAVARHGRLDVLINNAGIAPAPDEERFERAMANQVRKMEGRLDEMEPLDALTQVSDADWDLMLRTHLYGAFHGCRAALRHMQSARRGAIVNIASILGLWPAAGAASYSVAKAGIIALTKSVAGEVAHLGIRVNAVCPGYIDTPLLAPMTDAMRLAVGMRIGMNRMGRPEEIAEMVRFLAGPESSYCTGDVLVASGGYV